MAWIKNLVVAPAAVAVCLALASVGVLGVELHPLMAQESPAAEQPAATVEQPAEPGEQSPETAEQPTTAAETAEEQPSAAGEAPAATAEAPTGQIEPSPPPEESPASPAAPAAGTEAPGEAEQAAAAKAEVPQDIRDAVWIKLLVFVLVLVLPFGLGTVLSRQFRMPDYYGKITLVLFAGIAGVAVTVMGWPPKLGIDLSGGVILIYEIEGASQSGPADMPGGDDDDAAGQAAGGQTKVDMNSLIAAVSRRINPGGIKEVTIRGRGANEIEIIVPEVDESEVARLKRILTSVGTLEFRILANDRDHPTLIERAFSQPGNKILDGEGNLLAWWVPVARGKEGSFPYPEIARRDRTWPDGQPGMDVLVVSDKFNVNGGYLTRASEGIDQSARPCVNFSFNNRGGQLFGGLTSNNLPEEVQDFSRKLGIILDDHLHSAPAIRSTIREDGQITGDFTREEVDELVAVLNAGKLPAELSKTPISELVTGPTLGLDTIRKGSVAIALSLMLVLTFMLFYYRFSGVIACFALGMTLVMLLAIMITVKAAFTLPGIAGLVLTVGMAVDANVLIFERIREELERQATLRMAIRNGFGRALSAIVDANLTTLITATVLYVVGTDQIRGFAVTLWLGVVLSMFTAIFCSRVVFDVAERQKWISRLSMMRILGGTHIDFLGKRRVAAVLSMVIIVLGLAGVAARGKGLLDIDFTGGASIEIVFTEPQRTTDIRSALADLPDLAVSNVQLTEETPNLRFMINTSSPPDKDGEAYLEEVKQKISQAFGRKLAHYSMAIGPLEEVAGRAAGGSPAKEQTGQSRPDLPVDTLLASADPSAVMLAQAAAAAAEPAEPSAEETEKSSAAPAEEPPAAPAEESTATLGEESSAAPAEEAMPSGPELPPAAEPDVAPAGKPAAEEPAAEEPAREEPAREEAAPTAEERFAGGTQAALRFEHPVNHDTLAEMFRSALEEGEFPSVDFELSSPDYEFGDETPYNAWDVKILLPPPQAEKLFAAIKDRLENTPVFPSAASIGSKVAGSMQVDAAMAIFASLVFIIGYLWVRFQRVMYGLAAVVAVFHDVLVTLGAIAISAYVADYLEFLLIEEFKISLSVLAAFLTIIGYSLNDTIVIFDRIREVKGKLPFLTEQMVNASINQTLSRTLLTSFTTLLVVVVLYIGGGQGIHTFAFSLVVGVVVGTYSTIYIASPILIWMSRPAANKQ